MFTLRSALPLIVLVGLGLANAWLGTQATLPNLVANPGFEEGTAPWEGNFSIAPAPLAHTGSAAAALSASSAGSVWQMIPAEAGATYAASAWALKDDPAVQSVTLHLIWCDAEATYIGSVQSGKLTVDSSSYRQLTIASATAPPGTSEVIIQLASHVMEGESGTVYLDDASLIMLSGPPPTSSPTCTPSPSETSVPSPTRTPTPTTPPGTADPTSTATPTALPPDALKINEFLARPAPLATAGPPESAREWIELYNASEGPISLEGCMLDDGEEAEEIPAAVVPPGGFIIVVGSMAAFRADYPSFGGLIVEMQDGSLGNGLANAGDNLTLRDGAGHAIDALSYGDNRSIFDPPCPAVAAGHSLEREPTGYDTDHASDFVERGIPSPGEASIATPTVAPTRIYHGRLPLLIKHRR